MTTEASDTKKHPLFSHLEPVAVTWAIDHWKGTGTQVTDPYIADLSIAISLKRIADALEEATSPMVISEAKAPSLSPAVTLHVVEFVEQARRHGAKTIDLEA